jgi:predicted DsbA family dithiol-disulfide isomerase
LQREYGVSVEWAAFELHPEVPPEGRERDPNMRRRPGAGEVLQGMAAEDGIEIKTSRIQANSHRAFELAAFASESGKADAIHRALFHAYFTESRNIGDLDVLLAIADEAGLDVNEARLALSEGRFAGAVDEEITWARDCGITATPTFVFDERYALVGAQEYAAFERMMERLGHPKLQAALD